MKYCRKRDVLDGGGGNDLEEAGFIAFSGERLESNLFFSFVTSNNDRLTESLVGVAEPDGFDSMAIGLHRLSSQISRSIVI